MGVLTKRSPTLDLHNLESASSSRESHAHTGRPQAHVEFSDRVSLMHELDQTCGSWEILRHLSDESQSTAYSMTRQLHPSPNGIKSSLRKLEWLGLIERVPGGSVSKPFCLTEQGKTLMERPLRAWPLWLTLQR